ncbi:hypothetical protein EVA_15354 [gut metagenome]|uniref:Uncharacterized protein n=1 Tax=gut metagenome TaxID=749906 RepID=J9FQ09_9ZZZZ
MNEYDKKHLRNLTAVERAVRRIFMKAAEDAARLGMRLDISPGEDGKPISFADYPGVKPAVDRLLGKLKEQLEAAVVNGVKSAWTLANNKNDALSRRVFGENVGKLTPAQYRRYFSTNAQALEAFLARKTEGLSLSDRVWNYTNAFREQIELGLEVGIRSGTASAGAMAEELKQWLVHPDKLFRRVRDKEGLLQLSSCAKAFHPGRGVYRSSYMNARRLAATETNTAYRTADHLRWQQMDFVVGIEICLSNNHTVRLQPGETTDDPAQLRKDGTPKANAVRPLHDICDELKGRYPKSFKFTGWHPHCRCYAVTVLKTDEELDRDNEMILNGEKPNASSDNITVALPDSFLKWLDVNSQRIKKARTMPYFITDNEGLMTGDFLDRAIVKTRNRALSMGNEVQGLAESVAGRFGAVCTPINFKSEGSIKRKVLSERQDMREPTFSPDRLKDIVRTTIVADRDKINDIIKTLQGEECFMRLKRQNTLMGYTGNIINITTSAGLTAEIQINTARMIYAKENPDVAKSIIGDKLWNRIHRETGLEGGLGHTFYEQWRRLNPASQEAKAILKKSREYYRHFSS